MCQNSIFKIEINEPFPFAPVYPSVGFGSDSLDGVRQLRPAPGGANIRLCHSEDDALLMDGRAYLLLFYQRLLP